VKHSGLMALLLAASAMCVAQGMPSHAQMSTVDPHAGGGSPHGVVPSSRTVFGSECGLKDVSLNHAIVLSRSPQAAWALVDPAKAPGPNDTAVARIWRESYWMVDLHDAPGDGSTIHTGQMCFDPKGQITRMIDRYMDLKKCKCMRYTAANFDESGKAVKQEQKFVNMDTGVEMAAPGMAKDLPEVFGYRKLEQLPFYPLVKK